ncbi:MAG: hypothetical protein ABJA84_09420 [Polaromonas sp.]
MKHIVIKTMWTLMLMATTLIAGPPAIASPTDSGQKVAASKARKKAGSGGQIKFLPGSEETARERNTRLKRECKGRVNAGACAGYTY